MHNPDWMFAFNLSDSTNFEDYCQLLRNQSQGRDLKGFVTNSYMGAFLNGKCVGRSSIRHELNDTLTSVGGHIGYGVIPSERQKGYAREILRLSLEYLKTKNVHRALLTCSENNIGSIRTIEENGGILENKISPEGSHDITRRYWIDLSGLR